MPSDDLIAATSFVVLLRGVNVGGRNRIGMPVLRELLQSLGYAEVRTYLQSGNAVVSARDTEPDRVAQRIERAMAERLDLPVAVLVRSRAELADVVAGNPLLRPGRDGSKMLVLFLSGPPAQQRLDRVEAADYAPEEFAIGRKEIYLWCADGLQKSALARAFNDKALGVVTTGRNWNTVTRLLKTAG